MGKLKEDPSRKDKKKIPLEGWKKTPLDGMKEDSTGEG
jgi:hypothetical protein